MTTTKAEFHGNRLFLLEVGVAESAANKEHA